ncbi:MAG: hypothetical protein P8Y00_02260 [Deltaproteobacteria bacterium]
MNKKIIMCGIAINLLIEPLLMLIPVMIIAVLLWKDADAFYQRHSLARKEKHFLFTLAGFNGKGIAAAEIWIIRFRTLLVLTIVFLTGILCLSALF